MPWLSWLIRLFKQFVREKDNKSLIAKSPNKRTELFYEVKLHPGAICTFYLINPTDSRGDIELSFDEIPLLYQELVRQKLSRPISVRDSDLEKELQKSQHLKLNYRLTAIRSWSVQSKPGKERKMQELKYVIDFAWGIENQYDSPYRSFKNFAASLLKEELPPHHSDWGKYICNSYAIDWVKRLEIAANAKDIRVIFPSF
jgi:hypothetical protein